MNAVRGFFVVLLAHQAMGGAVRSPPAFSMPMYSDAYLPAAMQVIFHAVEQLKQVQSDDRREAITLTTPISLSESTEPVSTTTVGATTGQTGEDKDEDEGSKEATTNRVENTTKALESSFDDQNPEASVDYLELPPPNVILGHLGLPDVLLNHPALPEASLSDEQPLEISSIHQESTEASSSPQEPPESISEPSEVNEETPELNYATPETNYEAPELEHSVQETNEELPEADHELDSSSIVPEASTGSIDVSSSSGSIEAEQKKKVPTIDSVVQEVYGLVRPTASGLEDEIIVESKSAMGVSVEKMEALEDEDDENRFTRLGERVTQVPRPSLTSYLRRAKVPPSPTLQQLANLYDSLSKDARKQGFGKYTGYSDDVLKTLQTSAEGGVAPQLRQILEKILEREELSREDAKTRTSQAVKDLDNPSSTLSRDLRPLLPLRYSP